ncbi:MAG: 2-phospho-L-lactate transferase, partial [Angustibacter sp.]
MQITALSGGVGGARFLRGLLDYAAGSSDSALKTAKLTIIGNTGDDITMHGLRICPDLDSLLYTIGGVIHPEQGWGRADEGHLVQEELARYGCQPQWLTLGDRDLALHIARSELLHRGEPLSLVMRTLGARWALADRGIALLPMSDDPVETHIRVADPEPRIIHFQEWWIRHQASLPALEFIARGADIARPGPGVLAAIEQADVVLLPPSNPVVSIGIVLAVPGIREALVRCSAPVVGVSPIVHGRPVRGHADRCLQALGLP